MKISAWLRLARSSLMTIWLVPARPMVTVHLTLPGHDYGGRMLRELARQRRHVDR